MCGTAIRPYRRLVPVWSLTEGSSGLITPIARGDGTCHTSSAGMLPRNWDAAKEHDESFRSRSLLRFDSREHQQPKLHDAVSCDRLGFQHELSRARLQMHGAKSERLEVLDVRFHAF